MAEVAGFVKEVESAARYFPNAIVLAVESNTFAESHDLHFCHPWRLALVAEMRACNQVIKPGYSKACIYSPLRRVVCGNERSHRVQLEMDLDVRVLP